MPPAKKVPAKGKKPAPNTKAPAGSYALPGGGPGGADAYPLNTKARAANALSRVAANGTPAEKAKVRAAVKRTHPELPSSQGKGGSTAAKAAKPAASKTTKSKARPARKS
jgi:hypothetical protein